MIAVTSNEWPAPKTLHTGASQELALLGWPLKGTLLRFLLPPLEAQLFEDGSAGVPYQCT